MNVFHGKAAFITGAASGIGRATVLRLLQLGAELVASDVDAAGLATLGSHERLHTRLLDVRDATAVTATINESLASLGRLDYCFHIAGIGMLAELRDMRAEDWHNMIDVNLVGTINVAGAAHRAFQRQGHGHIVNMASLAGLVGMPTMAAYSTVKSAVVAYSRVLRAESASLGIRVSVVCPSFIESRIYEHATLRGITRDQARSLTPFPLMPTDLAVEAMLRGVAANRAVIVFPAYAKLLWYVVRACPVLAAPFNQRVLRNFRAVRRG